MWQPNDKLITNNSNCSQFETKHIVWGHMTWGATPESPITLFWERFRPLLFSHGEILWSNNNNNNIMSTNLFRRLLIPLPSLPSSLVIFFLHFPPIFFSLPSSFFKMLCGSRPDEMVYLRKIWMVEAFSSVAFAWRRMRLHEKKKRCFRELTKGLLA